METQTKTSSTEIETSSTEQTSACYSCSLMGAEECGQAEHDAQWVDADGIVSDETRRVCTDCLRAGNGVSGPGYRAV